MGNNIWAALMFFTRLPFWRLKTVPKECFRHVVAYWSVTGWLTGGTMALVCWASLHVLPVSASVLLALVSRLLLTGALHEDGLADFFDGFGGGHDRESILRIMKDSSVGSYALIGLIVYYILALCLLKSLPSVSLPILLLCCDVYAKFVCSHIVRVLPYARKEEESKSKVVYVRLSVPEMLVSAAAGLLPLLWLPSGYAWMLAGPCVLFFFLTSLFRYRLQGYTGDCCGALFLLAELSCWLGSAIVSHLN